MLTVGSFTTGTAVKYRFRRLARESSKPIAFTSVLKTLTSVTGLQGGQSLFKGF